MTIDQFVQKFTQIAHHYEWKLVIRPSKWFPHGGLLQTKDNNCCPITCTVLHETGRKYPRWQTTEAGRVLGLDVANTIAISAASDGGCNCDMALRERLLSVTMNKESTPEWFAKKATFARKVVDEYEKGGRLPVLVVVEEGTANAWNCVLNDCIRSLSGDGRPIYLTHPHDEAFILYFQRNNWKIIKEEYPTQKGLREVLSKVAARWRKYEKV